MRAFAMGMLLLTLALACRSGQSGPPTRPEQAAPRDRYLIKAAELESIGSDNLYDAVRQLRPEWFNRSSRNRSGEQNILLYLDDQQIGSAGTLRRFSARSVESVRYLSQTEAQVRYGQINSGRPAILIEMARQP